MHQIQSEHHQPGLTPSLYPSLSFSIHLFLFPFHWCWPGMEQFPCSPLLDAPFLSNSLIVLSNRLVAIHSPPSFQPFPSPSTHPFVLLCCSSTDWLIIIEYSSFLTSLCFHSCSAPQHTIYFLFLIPPSLHVIGYDITVHPFILPYTPPSIRPSQIEVL